MLSPLGWQQPRSTNATSRTACALACLFILAFVATSAGADPGISISAEEEAARITAIRERLVRDGLNWTAGRTSVSNLTPEAMEARLRGLNNDTEPSEENSWSPGSDQS